MLDDQKLIAAKDPQLEFLEMFSIPGKPKWTRALPFTDLVPKFLFTGTKKMNQISASTYRENIVEVDGKKFRLVQTPAHVAKGKTSFFAFPGEREEVVARALRYLIVQNQAQCIVRSETGTGPLVRTYFTIAQIQKILTETDHSHTFSRAEIDEALCILRGSSITLAVEGDKKAFFSGGLLACYSGIDGSDDPKDQRRFVQLNELEVSAILSGKYRALNFKRVMALRSPLARALFEFIMTVHRNAEKPPNDPAKGEPAPFRITLADVLTYCCIQPEKKLRRTIERIRSAIEELAQKGIFWSVKPFVEVPILRTSGRGRPKIVDIYWEVYLSREEVSDIIAAHSEAAANAYSNDPVLLNVPPARKAALRKMAKERHL